MAFPGIPTFQTLGSDGSSTSSTSCTPGKPTGLAVGDLMVAQFATKDSSTLSAPVGWTQVIQTGTGPTHAVFWKVADSSDVAASTFTFSSSATTNMYCIIGRYTNARVTTPIDKSNSANSIGTAVTVTTVTPTYTNEFLVFFISTTTDGTTGSGYAIVNNNPTWTEQYDNKSTTQISLSMANASRPQNTATGNWTATLSGSVQWSAIIITIAPIADAIASGTTAIATTTAGHAAVTTSSTVSGTSAHATAVANTATVTAGKNPSWTNSSKNPSTWTNQTKL